MTLRRAAMDWQHQGTRGPIHAFRPVPARTPVTAGLWAKALDRSVRSEYRDFHQQYRPNANTKHTLIPALDKFIIEQQHHGRYGMKQVKGQMVQLYLPLLLTPLLTLGIASHRSKAIGKTHDDSQARRSTTPHPTHDHTAHQLE